MWLALTTVVPSLGFPNNSGHEPVTKVFRAREHVNYKAAITRTRFYESDGSTWLHGEYHQDLVLQIKTKNTIRGITAVGANVIQ